MSFTFLITIYCNLTIFSKTKT